MEVSAVLQFLTLSPVILLTDLDALYHKHRWSISTYLINWYDIQHLGF